VRGKKELQKKNTEANKEILGKTRKVRRKRSLKKIIKVV
jgi:hypothetical protein